MTRTVSVANGPLSETIVSLAKVATTPPNDSLAQRVICVYMPDIFDKENVLEVTHVPHSKARSRIDIPRGYANSFGTSWSQPQRGQIQFVYRLK